MPALDGFAILAKLADRLRGSISLPVLVLTADASTATKERALAAGARDFLTKPFHFEEARLRVANLLAVREAQLKQHAIEDELERRVRSRTAELEVARTETLERLALAGEFRDEHTGQHTRRVASAARKLARQLGWGNDDADRLALAAPLHDIGKIAIPDSILLTPGPLTVAERRNMERHTVIGSRLLGDSPDPDPPLLVRDRSLAP
jgi:putative two-component system response regulator